MTIATIFFQQTRPNTIGELLMASNSQTPRTTEVIPIARPKLSSTRELAKYLNKIDNSRQYSNFGPLVRNLEGRLSLMLEGDVGTVVTASSGRPLLFKKLEIIFRHNLNFYAR